MSDGFGRRLLAMLERQLVRVAPPSRSQWAEGMRRELEEIENPGEAFRFVLGCLWACSLERLRSVELVLRLAKRTMVAATGLIAALGLMVAIHMAQVYAPSGLLIGTISIAFGAASLLLARRGPNAAAAVAVAMLVLSAAGLAAGLTQFREVQHATLYRALALEGLAMWSLLLAASLALSWATRSAWLRNLALERGWM
ncbi:MAG TPA: hypothetical protein VEB20_19750 [Azospirillaceae bacterium]|nr:hypothetical protein [Azospirillaceae bacterium]